MDTLPESQLRYSIQTILTTHATKMNSQLLSS